MNQLHQFIYCKRKQVDQLNTKLITKEVSLIKRALNVCVHSRMIQRTMDICMLETPGKAVEGGIQLSVDFSYQVPPNIHTEYVLFSKCTG